MGVEQVMPEKKCLRKAGEGLGASAANQQSTHKPARGRVWLGSVPCRAGEELIYPTRFDVRSVFVLRHPSFVSSFYRT